MKIKQLIQAMLLLFTLFVMLTIPAYALSEPSDLEYKIAQLTKALESKRIEHRIPGMAIAVVKDDQVVMAQGFGVMDVEQQTPVSAETLFSIGSSSKAFTATMLGVLVDQNKVSWDDQVTKHLPDYQFKVNEDTLPITYRDMLSHRTGYTRNDLLWANGVASRDTILKTATGAEPVDKFRKKFYYNNVMYLAVGEAMAEITGKSWDELLDEMIFKPLGMNNSTSIHEVAIKDERISLGYQWNEVTEKHDLMPRRNLNNVAPAGGIYSNVNDMAQWVRFQLNQGKAVQAGGIQDLISTKQLQTTHEAQIEIAGDVGYGLGWMLRKWQNQQVIEHGGNVDGYGAQVALLPESNLGFVLLTNVTATPLQQASMNMVWAHLAPQEMEVQTKASAKLDYQEFTGEYHANFGPFKDAIFTFLVKEDGKPAVDVPGQTVYELLDPDDTGKWFFKLTNTISVSFERGKKGAVTVMRMQQNGADFELPRKGYEILPEVEAGTFNEFLGMYDSEMLKGKIKAFIQNHRLTIDVPNQMAYELHLPDENGFRQFRIKADTSVKFVRNEASEVTAIALYKNKEELVESAPKLINTAAEVIPTVGDILKLRQTKSRKKALKKNAGFFLSGEIKIISSGIAGQVKTLFDQKDNFRQKIDFGVFGELNTVINKNQGSSYGINPYTELKGKYHKQMQRESPAVGIDWYAYYDDIKVIGVTEQDEIKVYEVRLKVDGLPAVTAYVDIKTGDVVKLKSNVLVPSIGSVGLQIYYSDYREAHGLRLPFKVTIDNPMMGKMVIQYDQFEAKQKFEPSLFESSKPK